ncbi:MAG: GHMP kinase, partial [Minisyncoccia bacterium]
MIIVRAPMRISFMGGGTDLAAFYTKSPGRVISAAIDKYVYVTVNRPPLLKTVSARYSSSELVDHPKELKNDRIREALLHLGITSHIDIGSFNDLPVKTGLGSSSSFAVALMKALLLAQGRKTDRGDVAELASKLEIELVKEPIGKQDQYASAFGGINIIQFNSDHSVEVSPVYLDFEKQSALEGHLQIFFTGITRFASSVLAEQKENTDKRPDTFKTLQKMADMVNEFRDGLLAGDFENLGSMLHEGWLMKKTLSSKVSLPVIDELYDAGKNTGAWGGKILGAGGGGCIMFMTPINKKGAVREAVAAVAKKNKLTDFAEMPLRLVKSGVEVLMN